MTTPDLYYIHEERWYNTITDMHKRMYFLFLLCLLFSFWLMFDTFSYDKNTHAMMVSQKVWSDFAQHIPLVRSFSLGNNWPPQHPLFPNEPIRYHFLFYAFVGMLERLGIRIDWALNIPSSLGFFLLMVSIILLAKKVFRDERVAVLSLIFFLFNGSLSFVQFFQNQPLTLANFPAFAPWGKGDITAFWNLNIYTNQRHLALAFGIAMFFLYFLISLRPRLIRRGLVDFAFAVLFGLLFGLFPFFHQPTLVILSIFMAVYFFLFPKLRVFLFMTGAITTLLVVPQLLLLMQGAHGITWYPGYLTHDSLTVGHFVSFWWQNLGIHAIFIPIGFFLASKKIRAFFLPIFFVFLLGNTIKFSPEAAANHKFFNFALILGQMLSAYALLAIIRRFPSICRICLFVGFVGLLTLSGVIDFLVIASDVKGALPDIPANRTAAWIAQNTPKDAVFLNSSFLYHPASIAGRRIFLGWPYFAWSEGYDTDFRLKIMQEMYAASDPGSLCSSLAANHISFVTFQARNAAEELSFHEDFYGRYFTQVFSDAREGFRIYSVGSSCGRML